MFYGELQGFVKEPANYFFYKNHLFLKESTYPYLNKDHQLMIGDKIFTEGSNPAIDQFYLSRLNEYKSLFKEKTISLKISCQYEARTMGGVKEDILLQMFESDQSFIFLASKEIHMMTRKDRMLHYVSDFMFSKAFFLDLQFKAN